MDDHDDDAASDIHISTHHLVDYPLLDDTPFDHVRRHATLESDDEHANDLDLDDKFADISMDGVYPPSLRSTTLFRHCLWL